MSRDIFVSSLKMLDTTEAYQLLIRIEEQFALDIVTTEFHETELFSLYIGDKWNSLKSEIPYVAFDLESDGNVISQFAFLTGSVEFTHEETQERRDYCRSQH